MELYLFRPADFQLLYNCSNIDIDSVPLANRRHILEGVIMILLCAIYYILYIPCTLSICKHLDSTVYRLLLYGHTLGVRFAHGILAIQGAVFCSSPNFIYMCGLFIAFFWMSESTCELILVINRCLAIISPDLEKALFGVQCTNNLYNMDLTVAIAIPLMYIIFLIAFRIKMTAFRGQEIISQNEKMLFLQVLLISIFNFVASSTYSYMNYHLPSEWLIHFAQFSWLQIHGFPPVIYLVLNKTIRKDTQNMLLSTYYRIVGTNKSVVTMTLTMVTENYHLKFKSNPQEFARAAVLMLTDWKTRFVNEPAALSFVEYFEKTWLHSPLSGWYEGFSAYSSTNNGLESKMES
uniref:Vomeronasal type-1 receptor n=1 Tax=Ditylenchus dipsaci TaxID=166011 RepID=A0A915EEL2_9BILA